MHKCRFGFPITLVSEFSSQSRMFEREYDLPFVPQSGMVIDSDDILLNLTHVQYKIADGLFSCVAQGHQVRDHQEFMEVCASVEKLGWQDVVKAREAEKPNIVVPGQ